MPNTKDNPINKLNDSEFIAQELYKRNLELHNERKRTEELLYRVSEAIYATDDECKITLFNHTLENLIGVTTKDVLGKDAKQYIHLTDEKDNTIDLTRLCRSGQTGDFDVGSPNSGLAILKTKTKSLYVHVKVSEIEIDSNKKEHLVTMSDVTREKELEKAKDEFISITSHELRTPMSIIKSYLWMLTAGKGGELTDKQKGYLEKAVTGTERMIALINDMLSVSRMEQGKVVLKKEKANVLTLLTEIKEEIEVKAKEKNLYLKLEAAEEIGDVYVDKGKFREIIVNLAGNSVKFTNSGGITIKAEPEDGDKYKISITDTGIGIEEDQLARLFHKFQRLDNSYQTIAESGGTGLGLYIVKLYIENMGGTVGVHSDGAGKGSTFWFVLPKV